MEASLTWAELEELPVQSVILYEGRPFQKTSQRQLTSGTVHQLWEGARSATLVEDAVNLHAQQPVLLIHRPTEEAPHAQ